jgi:prevent-host-death family protein
MVIDHDTIRAMEEMAISKFKATCLAALKRVQRTRRPILVTKFGKPVAQVVPPPPAPRPKRWLGDLVGTGKINGDIIAPASDEGDWEALRS